MWGHRPAAGSLDRVLSAGALGTGQSPSLLPRSQGRVGKGRVPAREAVCHPYCPLTKKGQVKQTLRAEPLSPWCAGFLGPP